MRTIIAGSRHIDNYEYLRKSLDVCPWAHEITVVISGHANGPDLMGEAFARKRGLPLEIYLPDWKTHGKSAGFIRNEEMIRNADALIALWDVNSRGTKHCIVTAFQKNLRVFVYDCASDKVFDTSFLKPKTKEASL